MSYRQGRQSPINIWETREGEDDRQVAMATTEHKAAELVRLANLGAELEARLADGFCLVRYRPQGGLSGFEYDDDGNRLRRVTILEEAPDGGS